MKGKEQARVLARSVYLAIKETKDVKKVVDNFLIYINQHRLENLIKEVLKELEQLYFEEKNIVSTKVITKEELNKDEIKVIEQLVKQKTDKQALVQTELNQEILGGVVVKYHDKVIDLSLKNQLNNLAKQLSK